MARKNATSPPAMAALLSPTYRLFREAILREKQVVCIYDGFRRELCPHIIGHKNGAEKVLAFQFGGEATEPLPPGGQWKCLFLSKVRNAVLRDGPWHEGQEHGSEQRCVDDVDLDLNIHVRKLRTGVVLPFAQRRSG